MRIWQFWWRTIIFSRQYNPAGLIELIMLMFASGLIIVFGVIQPDWPYLALGLSYMVGAAVSMLVREALVPSPQPRITQIMAVMLLIFSLYGFADLARYL